MLWINDEFSRQLRLFLVVLIKVYYGKGQNKYFWRNLRPEQTCDLNFKRGKNNPLAISFNFLNRFSYAVLFTSIKTAELLLFLAICLNFSDSSHNRNLKRKLNVLHLFAKCWICSQYNRTEILYNNWNQRVSSMLASEVNYFSCITLVSKERQVKTLYLALW